MARVHPGLTDAAGKRVVDAEGTEVGLVRSVDNGLAYIEPGPRSRERLLEKLDWGDPGRNAYPLDCRKIHAITDETVRLQEAPDSATHT